MQENDTAQKAEEYAKELAEQARKKGSRATFSPDKSGENVVKEKPDGDIVIYPVPKEPSEPKK
jgi:hypothetical protein